jgi:hypothetical protein
MKENKSGKRIIAIAVSPSAYDEILNLKKGRTWTRWLVELMLLEAPTSKILNKEMQGLTKKPKAEPKAEKVKAEKPKRDRKAKKVKVDPQPEVKYGEVDPNTGGTPIDISKIRSHKPDPKEEAATK